MAAEKELIPLNSAISETSEITHIDYFRGKTSEEKNQKSNWERTGNVKAFYIPIGKPASFRFKVTDAKNPIASSERVFLAMQPLDKFKEPEGWMPIGNKVNKEALHELINNLSRKQIELPNGHPDKFHALSPANTKGIGTNYLQAFSVDKAGVFYPENLEITLKADDIGKAFWLEGFNFLPEWGDSKSSNPRAGENQGFIVAGVDDVQILNFYAKKRTEDEKDIKSVKQKTITEIPDVLAYGDILDFHISIHTQNKPFSIYLAIVDDDSKETVTHLKFDETEYKNTPSAFQNLYSIKEINLLPQWIDIINHKEPKEGEKSERTFTATLALKVNEYSAYEMGQLILQSDPKYVKKITFKIDYKDEWAIDEDEQEWIPQIAEIQEATLVTQGHEECSFTAIEINDGTECSPFHILKQNTDDGSLEVNETTPILEYVAGNKNNVYQITIDLKKVKTEECLEAGFDNATARDKSHKNNTFIVPDYDIENKGVTISGTSTEKEKWKLFDHNRFFETETFEEQGKRTQEQLKFKLAYPYDAYNEHTFLLKYLTFQIKPEYLPVIIQSCRYIRTPVFKVYPDAVFAYHYMYDPAEELWFNDTPVDLPELKGDVLSYVKDIVDWVYTPLKPILEYMGVDKEVLQLIENYINSPSPNQKIGFHMLADSEEINYSQIQPYKAFFYYQMVQIALLPLVIEILLIYLTRGKNLQSKLGKMAKKVKTVRADLKKFGNDYNIELISPKLCVNYGMYRQQEEKGNVSIILEYTLQAKPLLGLKTTQEFKFKFPGGKVRLEAIFKGKLEIDINLKYNTYTKAFTLNKNAKDQTGQSGVPYTEGDIIKADRYISCNIEIDAGYKAKGSFEVLWIDVPYEAKIDAEFNINGAIGTETRFGYGAEDGLYYQNIYYFTGAKGKYKAEVKASVGIWKIFDYMSGDNENEAEWVDVQVLEPFTWTEPRTYIVKTVKDLAKAFNKKQPNETFKPTTPPAPTVVFSNNTSNTNN